MGVTGVHYECCGYYGKLHTSNPDGRGRVGSMGAIRGVFGGLSEGLKEGG